MKLINLINFYTKLFSILIINSSFSDSVSKNEKNILASHETTNLFQLGRNKYLLKKEVVKRLADDNIRHYKILLVGDIYEKGFTVSLRNQCKNEGIHLKLIVVVLSNPLSFFARNSIRETWGVGNKDVQIIFLFGSHTDSWTEKHLKEEENTYNDIVRGHFLDSYSNFTLKTVSALEWIATYCSKAKFMLKVHDNVFINMPYLKTFVKTHMNYQNAIFARFVQVENKSIANSSLFLKEENISNSSAVIMGHTYLITIDSIKKLYNQTLKKYLINPIVNFCNFILKQYYSYEIFHFLNFCKIFTYLLILYSYHQIILFLGKLMK